MESLGEWNQRYKEEDMAATTKVFFSDAISAYPQTRLGGKFKHKESPSYVCDPEQNGNVIHLITACPIYAREMTKLETEIKEKDTADNLSKVIKSTFKVYHGTMVKRNK